MHLYLVKGKGHPMILLCRHVGEAGGISLPIRNPAMEGGRWSAPRSDRFRRGKDPIPIVKEVGWASETVWTVRKIWTPLGFDSRTVESVASFYTDLTIPTPLPTPIECRCHTCMEWAGTALSSLLCDLMCVVITEVIRRSPAFQWQRYKTLAEKLLFFDFFYPDDDGSKLPRNVGN